MAHYEGLGLLTFFYLIVFIEMQHLVNAQILVVELDQFLHVCHACSPRPYRGVGHLQLPEPPSSTDSPTH